MPRPENPQARLRNLKLTKQKKIKMSSPVPSPTWDCTKSPRWQALLDSARAGRKIKDLFATDPRRFQKFSRACNELTLDFSKNTMDDEALSNLLALLKEANVEEYVNQTAWNLSFSVTLPAGTETPCSLALRSTSPKVALFFTSRFAIAMDVPSLSTV